MILGELKRFFRDDGMIKVSRSIKENQHRVYLAREKIEKELGREPSLKEIAEMLEMPPEEVAMTMDSAAEVESLYRTVYQSEGTDISLIDKIPEKENLHDRLLNKIFLEELLKSLNAEERKLLYMRYFREMTQMETADEFGVSQVQISRMEKKILNRLRTII
jgi:RNA polymerase sporulation-specific sigma factor